MGTCPDTLARTHIKKFTSTQAGKAAARAEDGKLKKYRHLNNDYCVVPIGIETLGSLQFQTLRSWMGCTTSNSNIIFTNELFRIISLVNFNFYPTVIFSLINPK